MKIDAIELRLVSLRLRERFEISSGGRQDRDIFLVRLRAEGITAWGECVVGEDPGYSYETTETAWHLLRDFLVPAVLAAELPDPTVGGVPAAVERAMTGVRGHPMAKAALEMAAWDLQSKAKGRALVDEIGGRRVAIPVGVSIGLQRDDDTLLRKIQGYLEDGYARIKMKIKPGRDLGMLRTVRDAFPALPILADANSAYTLGDLPRLRELDDLNLMMIEQPLGCEDVLDHARLQAELRTPVCLDESIRSPGDVRLALELDAARVINVKPGRVGGFGSAIRIHDLCRDAGVPVWCGGMLESGVGRAFNVALATLPGFTLPGDISASSRYWERDLVDPEWELRDGTLTPLDGSGIGVEPALDRIDAATTRKEEFTG